MNQMSAPDPYSGVSVLARNPSQLPLRLLAFDGGGIRGLSSLFVLGDIMEQIRLHQHLDETPHPHKFFDLIGGTGTGGLIAILLGHLRMSVDDAVAVYLSVVNQVFTTSICHLFRKSTQET
jgi:patatin-like phospholipase/acyl hydrolase